MQFTLEHAQDVLSGMPDPTFILSEDGIYIDVFGGTDKKAYHDGSNLIGKTLHSVLEKEQADWFIEQINRSLNQDSIVTIEYKMCADSIQGIECEQWAKRRPLLRRENLSAHYKLSRSSRCSHSYPQHFQPPPSRNPSSPPKPN
ncbi:hypothetical protein NI380_03965 [Vibrio parahaemolyticus]|uniref:hypothetical protein n=1 Tax=Vibrio parahaemolyticus TaxID=670 RepID=UPI0027E580CA|nr:hypothetical protein [Vibrio parahaemolyticus]WMN96806.1 hypothetical protein NI380_03965 [Vibrio parahaemolyticus]